MHGELTWGDEVYMSLLDNAAWRSLHDYVHSEAHARQLCSVFAASLAQHVETGELLLDPEKATFDEHMEGRAIRRGLLEGGSGAVRLFARLDLGYGIEDYGRWNGGHLDNASRLFSTLVYFSDARDFHGGEFEGVRMPVRRPASVRENSTGGEPSHREPAEQRRLPRREPHHEVFGAPVCAVYCRRIPSAVVEAHRQPGARHALPESLRDHVAERAPHRELDAPGNPLLRAGARKRG
jgi:hypothetical protein